MPDWLVIGWGNPLRQDDGAGFRAAAVLGGIAVQQLGPELAMDIAGADGVVFIDSDSTLPGGEWRAEALGDVQTRSGSTHSYAPYEVLRIASMLYDAQPECMLVRIGGENYGHGEELSPAVAAAVDEVVAYVREHSAKAS